MSILIKGMEMPKDCFRCPLSVLNGERLFCEVTKDEVVRAKRASDCPLVELPPHGRLIDADALIVDLMDRGVEGLQTDDWHEIQQSVEDAPTVIEAERKE